MKLDYVKKGQEKVMKNYIDKNTDFYGGSIVNTAIFVMKKLMDKKFTPKQAWKEGMEKYNGHSGMSAAYTATMVVNLSPRGEEFKNWCIKDNVVWVDWKDKQK